MKFLRGLAASCAHVASLRKERAEEKSRAQDIRTIAPKPENPNSLSSLIYSVLQKTGHPIHITEIISQVEALGCKSKSQYHVYSRFQRELSRNYDMFQRQGNGLYSLRSRPVPTKTEARAKAKTDTETPIATLKDIVVNVAKDYLTPDGTTTPTRVHYVLTKMGLRCAYSAIYRVMQSDGFVREGFNYRVL